jgi:hypothetical protein
MAIYSFAIPIVSPQELMRSTERVTRMLGDIGSRVSSRFAQAKMEAKTGSEREHIEEMETAHKEQEAMLADAWMSPEGKEFFAEAMRQ